MTVSSSTSFVSYAGNGSLTTFAYTFKIFQDSDLLVTLVNDASGAETTKVLTTDYTVTGAGSAGGGNVVLTTAPASGTTLKIRRVLPVTQETDYVANDPFPAEAHEDALDKLTMLVQQEAANSDLAISFPEGDVGSGLNNIVPAAVDRADRLLSFDTEGSVTTKSAAEIFLNDVIGANYTKASHTGNGSITAFSTSSDPGSKNNIQVYIDGVYQNKDTFSISGSTLTFSEAPPLNSAIEFIVGNAVTSLTTDPDVVTYNQGGTGAQDRTLTSKLQDTVSVKDFGAVGDGVADDTAAIQAAINAASGVYFPSGTYKVVTGGITLTSDVNLYSNDFAVIDGASASSNVFTGTAVSDVSVKGLSFIYDTGATEKHLFTLDGCFRVSFLNNTFTSEDGSITGNVVPIRVRENSGVSGSKDIVIDGNIFTGPRLLFLSQAASGYPNENITISNNIFTNNASSVAVPNNLDGIIKIDLYSDYVTIVGNICNGASNVESFIHLEEGIANVTVDGNTVYDCTEFGILVAGGQGPQDVNKVSITGNTVEACSIGVEGVTSNSGEWIISNNVVSSSTLKACIDLSLANDGVNCIISNNILKTSADEGIYCRADNATITGNNISGATNQAIYVYQAPNCVISNNNITQTNNVAYPLHIRESDDCIVIGNSVKGTATVTAGIAMVTCDRGSIQSNYIEMANATNSIRIDGTSSDVSVVGNVSSGALDLTYSSNHVSGNINTNASVNSVTDLGNYFLWVDSTGDLRINGSQPSTDTDGTVVGTQT